MLTPRDPEFAREKILSYFNAFPTLHFDSAIFSEINYAEPKLVRPPEFFNANRHFPSLNPGLVELFKCFELGTQKLEYGRTDSDIWNKYFRFYTDRLTKDANHRFKIHSLASPTGDYVNASKSVATEWFCGQLIPWLAGSPGSHAYVLGDPGAGKSTLIKYLINSNASHLQHNAVVVSRFEFLKFRYRWCTNVDFSQQAGNAVLRHCLSEYISFIVLRDVLWSRGYLSQADGGRRRAFDLAALKIGIAAALGAATPRDPKVEKISALVDDAMGETKLDFSRIGSIPHDFRVLIAKQMMRGHSLIVVFDGLDCIAVEDARTDSERAKILKLIMDNRTNLTKFILKALDLHDNAVYSQLVEIPASALFVMRENTFYLHEDGLKNEVRLVQPKFYRVGSIDPEVAIFNVVDRAVNIWAARSGIEPNEAREVGHLLIDATFLALKFINRAVGTRKPSGYILGLFCGNIRTLFQFMSRLLHWFLHDALRDGYIQLTPQTTVKEIFAAMTGAAGLEILRRKSYRIIEILLFSDVPWFENQVLVENRSALASAMLGGSAAPVRDNGQFSGVVDNIFNYHSARWISSADRHCLLEKIWIVQLLESGAQTSDELEGALHRRLGYKSPNLAAAMQILIRTQMVVVSVKEGEVYLSPTERGRIVVNYLGRTLPYIEHVFHRTLLPKVLIERVDDECRIKDVDRWTSASIRNAFIFLSYLRFVENDKAGGKSVPASLRIYEDTRARVIQSIRRILMAGEYLARSESPQDRVDPRRESAPEHRNQIVRQALRLIENTANEWEHGGFSTPTRAPQSPGPTGRSG